jgi:hypothetical protein
MSFIPVIVNALVICVISAELIAISLGMVSADQLLVSSTISGLLTLLSFKLSKDALEVINCVPDSVDEQPESEG